MEEPREQDVSEVTRIERQHLSQMLDCGFSERKIMLTRYAS